MDRTPKLSIDDLENEICYFNRIGYKLYDSGKEIINVSKYASTEDYFWKDLIYSGTYEIDGEELSSTSIFEDTKGNPDAIIKRECLNCARDDLKIVYIK